MSADDDAVYTMQAVKIVLPVFPSQLIFVFHVLRRFYSVAQSSLITHDPGLRKRHDYCFTSKRPLSGALICHDYCFYQQMTLIWSSDMS